MPAEQDKPAEKPAKSVRLQRREARMKFVRDAREPRKVRVTPADESRRGRLVHPRKGGFRSTGSVEWPLDTFTKRRIRDGDVIVEEREQNRAPDAREARPRSRPGSVTGDHGTGRTTGVE